MPPEGMEIPAEYQDEMEDTRARLRKMAGSGGLDIVFTGRIPNSRRALEATEYARNKGRDRSFHRAVFHRLYGEGRDIHDWRVLGGAAAEAGLDPDEMQSMVEGGNYANVLEEKIARAVSLGIKAVPTFIFNDRFRIVGAQPVDVFKAAIEQIEREEGKTG